MEIEDSAYPCVAGVIVTSDARVAFNKADYAILLGGFPRKPVRRPFSLPVVPCEIRLLDLQTK
jgi:malate/lactate dehydrogenase